MTERSMSGQVAMVTGGGSGVGAEVARALAANGANVVVAGRREERLLEVVEGLEVEARAMGFLYVASGPLVRSSYKAGEYFAARLVNARRRRTS